MNLKEAWMDAQHRLQDARVESPTLDARILLEAAVGKTREEILMAPYVDLSIKEIARLEVFLDRRIHHEPVAKIVGHKEFYGLEFMVNEHVLDPRPDTETLIDAVLEKVASGQRPAASDDNVIPMHERFSKLTILDLGTGSGCILLTLLKNLPQARGIGVDLSEEALRVATANARSLGLEERVSFVSGDWDAASGQIFDIVVSNPPYIPTAEIQSLMPEVRDFEPRAALDGGDDGLDAYRALAKTCKNLLAPHGLLALEIGMTQEHDVRELMSEAGLVWVESVSDLAGIARCLLFTI